MTHALTCQEVNSMITLIILLLMPSVLPSVLSCYAFKGKDLIYEQY